MTTHRSEPTDAGRAMADVRELLDLCTKGATVHDRQDLVERLAGARRALETAVPAGGAVRDAAAVVLRACDSLEVDLRALRAHLRDPGRAPRLQAELADARARREAFESRVQTWPAVLGEGFAALSSDLEFEVRRVIGRPDLGVSEYVIRYDGKPVSVIGIIKFEGGKVAHWQVTLKIGFTLEENT